MCPVGLRGSVHAQARQPLSTNPTRVSSETGIAVLSSLECLLQRLRAVPNGNMSLSFSHQCLRKKPWTHKKNAATITSLEVTMTFRLSSRSTQLSGPSRLPVIDFEPLLDAIEAAALLRMHPNTLRMKARLGKIPGRHIGKYWRFRISDLNDWIGRQEQERRRHTNPLMATSA
jgi:excisionase family DNA binding protein